MDWKRERDALIAQTFAFVQSVTAKREETAGPEARLPPVTTLQPPPPEVGPVEAAPVDPVKTIEPPPSEPPPSAFLPLPIVHSEVQDEIRARIASFRAHQERFNRERADYFSATLARLRAAIDETPTPRV